MKKRDYIQELKDATLSILLAFMVTATILLVGGLM